jgi:hypothetical protein
MKTGYSGAHRPLLEAMLPAGNEAAEEGDAADGDNPPSPDAADAGADASASAAADAGTSNAADANASIDAEDQPLPSPRPTTPDEMSLLNPLLGP